MTGCALEILVQTTCSRKHNILTDQLESSDLLNGEHKVPDLQHVLLVLKLGIVVEVELRGVFVCLPVKGIVCHV